MTNIITLNGKQVAAFNGYSIGSYNDNEVTQAITNDNKEPLFDTTGIENINGLTYPFKINVICNDERLTITEQCGLYRDIVFLSISKDPSIYLHTSIENATLRSVSDITAPFSQWNSASIGEEGTIRYIFYIEDLPAYTYNQDGVIKNLYINYIPGSTTYYYKGENFYEGYESSVDIDEMTWKDHYMTDVFDITTSLWAYIDTEALPSIQNFPNAYKAQDLEFRQPHNGGLYTGNFITFDFSNYIGKTIKINYDVYQNKKAKEEGKYTFYKIELLNHIPTAEEILNDFNATNVTISGSIAPDSESPEHSWSAAHVTEANHIFTLYPSPTNLDHNQTGLEGYTANRFDIKSISIKNN